jgi:hypothetical protein
VAGRAAERRTGVVALVSIIREFTAKRVSCTIENRRLYRGLRELAASPPCGTEGMEGASVGGGMGANFYSCARPLAPATLLCDPVPKPGLEASTQYPQAPLTEEIYRAAASK